MKQIITLFFTLLLIANTAFAFPNEPEGFRDLKWGDSKQILFKQYPNTTLQKTLVSQSPAFNNKLFTIYKVILRNNKLSSLDLNKEANFVFYDDKFIGVILESNIVKPYSEFANIHSEFFENMIFLFGSPTEQKASQYGTKHIVHNIWNSNEKSNITVITTMNIPSMQSENQHNIKIHIFQQEFYEIFVDGKLYAKYEEVKNQGW